VTPGEHRMSPFPFPQIPSMRPHTKPSKTSRRGFLLGPAGTLCSSLKLALLPNPKFHYEKFQTWWEVERNLFWIHTHVFTFQSLSFHFIMLALPHIYVAISLPIH
jgi:hypothetical protein